LWLVGRGIIIGFEGDGFDRLGSFGEGVLALWERGGIFVFLGFLVSVLGGMYDGYGIGVSVFWGVSIHLGRLDLVMGSRNRRSVLALSARHIYMLWGLIAFGWG
jgi:hypothetical protein